MTYKQTKFIIYTIIWIIGVIVMHVYYHYTEEPHSIIPAIITIGITIWYIVYRVRNALY